MIKVSMSWEKLAAMEDNGAVMWGTPGASEPYWDSQQAFQDDKCLATVHDFETDGIEYNREDECDEVYSVKIEMPTSR